MPLKINGEAVMDSVIYTAVISTTVFILFYSIKDLICSVRHNL